MWRAMRAEDKEGVGAISDAVHGRYTEPAETYAERQRLYPAGCWVYEQAGALSGYLVSHPWYRGHPPPLGALIGAIGEDADSYYLHDLALLPICRGTGAGVAAAEQVVRQATLAGFAKIFLVAVNGAESFWLKQHFLPVPDDGITAYLHANYGPDVLYMERRIRP